jgi:hypothetical protein
VIKKMIVFNEKQLLNSHKGWFTLVEPLKLVRNSLDVRSIRIAKDYKIVHKLFLFHSIHRPAVSGFMYPFEMHSFYKRSRASSVARVYKAICDLSGIALVCNGNRYIRELGIRLDSRTELIEGTGRVKQYIRIVRTQRL